MADKKYRMVSLFSGAMGLDIGIESVGGFQLLAAIEKESVFRQTIEANIAAGRVGSSETVLLGDINDVVPSELRERLGLARGELDLLVGGPPCQAFSTAGRRRTVLDPRGTLLWRYLDFVAEFRPKVFLMENVRGLVSAALRHRAIAKRPERGGEPLDEDETPGSVLRQFHRDLLEATDGAYRLDGFEVNSVNYGSPQIRERLLIFGNRLGRAIEFPEPTHASPEEVSGGRQPALFDPPSLSRWATLQDAIGNLHEDEPELLNFSPRKLGFLKQVPPGSNWRSLPESVQRESMGRAFHAKGGRSGWWRRLTFDLPCPTLITMPNHASTSLCHPTETRVLSVREYARIQEFPDNWEICGTTAEKYRQIGNAVPVRLGRVAGTTVREVLQDDVQKSGLVNGQNQKFRLVYLKSHIRTRRWFKSGEVTVWADGTKRAKTRPGEGATTTLRRESFL